MQPFWRCLDAVEGEDFEGAFRRYEAHRKPRTSVIQAISSANSWMREGDSDTSWLYGYDAWRAPLNEPADRGAMATQSIGCESPVRAPSLPDARRD